MNQEHVQLRESRAAPVEKEKRADGNLDIELADGIDRAKADGNLDIELMVPLTFGLS